MISKVLALCWLVIHSVSVYAQAEKFKCPCSTIGLADSWADSASVSCYLIPVSRDAFNKSAGNFKLAVAVASPLSATKEKPLLYLHGGPGIATLGNLPNYLKSATWKQIRETRSIVFFDYRGTGYSEPSLCPDLDESLKRVADKLSPQQLNSHRIELLKKCRIKHFSEGIDIATFSSFQSAEDAESIRASLGIDTWNVYGVSHGTTVALNLLRNHDKRIQSMILDSPFPPNAPWLDFVRPFAVSFEVLEKKLSEDETVSTHFASIRKDFVKAVEQLNKTPYKIAINDSGATYPFTGNDFAWSVWTALLKPASIPFVPLAIKEAASGNTNFLSKWVVAFNNPNAFGKFSEHQSKAILCYEGRPKNEADSKAALQKAYPDFTAFNIDFESDLCNAWQPKSAGQKLFEPVTSTVPVLVLSGEYDPVCPPLFGELTAKTLSRSTFINVPAASHAAIHVDDCIREIATTFLSNPSAKVEIVCVGKRSKIVFLKSDLENALSDLQKNKRN